LDLSLFSSAGFDRGAPLWKEVLWTVIRCLFFAGAWPWPSWWRAFWLRRFGAHIGRGVVIRSRGHIHIPWRLRVGDSVWIGEEACLLNLADIVIEDSVCVSQRVFLCTGSHDYHQASFALITKPITLRRGCWVAAQAFVGPGVEIGCDAVVSAGSVVLKDVPAGGVARGNPAELRPVRLNRARP
jgi:putative colanic acid biosynthesis acetyltransferase WcaF